ncbi:hypothetical protein O3M35_000531 [Rhynocoris fuscipes]|uniref:Uncharacterized protein n=1 Tax=Rhynocoris fuscipes TaxID=488301 RepID=A0AAW1DSY2_9HEMI
MPDKTNIHELLHLIKQLVYRIEQLPTEEPTCYPSFLCQRRPRYQIDWDKVPLITNDSILEIRPTHLLKYQKNNGFKLDKVFIRINAVHNSHASPPWYHPCDPAFRKEQAIRDMKDDIYPAGIDTVTPCQMPAPDIGYNKELDCESCAKDKSIKICKWKHYDYQPCREKEERFLCKDHHCYATSK